jgi:hypothetical protein
VLATGKSRNLALCDDRTTLVVGRHKLQPAANHRVRPVGRSSKLTVVTLGLLSFQVKSRLLNGISR